MGNSHPNMTGSDGTPHNSADRASFDPAASLDPSVGPASSTSGAELMESEGPSGGEAIVDAVHAGEFVQAIQKVDAAGETAKDVASLSKFFQTPSSIDSVGFGEGVDVLPLVAAELPALAVTTFVGLIASEHFPPDPSPLDGGHSPANPDHSNPLDPSVNISGTQGDSTESDAQQPAPAPTSEPAPGAYTSDTPDFLPDN